MVVVLYMPAIKDIPTIICIIIFVLKNVGPVKQQMSVLGVALTSLSLGIDRGGM